MSSRGVEMVNPGWLFQRLRGRLLRNATRQVLGGAAERPLVIFWACLVVWMFVFAISMGGFRFLQFEFKCRSAATSSASLIDLLFLTLGVLLIFSSGLILYGSLFDSPETDVLAQQAGHRRSRLRLQVPGSGGVQQLGVPAAGRPGADRLRPGHAQSVVISICSCRSFSWVSSCCRRRSAACACLLIVNFVPRASQAGGDPGHRGGGRL